MSAHDYYVLRLGEDLRHGELAVVRLWAPQALGYVHAVEKAGVYTMAEIGRHHVDAISAAAVPCAIVEAVVVKRGEIHVFPQRELARVIRAAARVAAYRARVEQAGGAS